MESTNVTYPSLEYTDLTEQTYRVLKDKILRCELKPGEQISVPAAALALGVSRTPVTDALKRLASEGLVEIVPRQGTFVTELTARDVIEIFDIRVMIEMHAAETVFETGKVAQLLPAMRAPLHAMKQAIDGNDFRDYEAFTTNDREFHTALINATNNQRLIRTYTQLHVHTYGARVHYLNDESAQETHNEHQAIVAAFERGDLEQVKEVLRAHIASVKARILELLDSRGGKL